MTEIFKMFGGGDAMTGMTYMTYGFVAIIALIIVICVFVIIRNYLSEHRKNSVSLKSKTAEAKASQRKKGLFNYNIIDGEDDATGLDPTDPANQKNRRHANRHATTSNAPRKGLKPAKASLPSKAVPKVGLKKSVSSPSSTASMMPVQQTATPQNAIDGMFVDDGAVMSLDNNAPIAGNAPSAPVQSSLDDTDFTFDQPPVPAPVAPQMPTMPAVPVVQPVVPQQEVHSPKHAASPQVLANPFEATISPDSMR